MNYYFIISNLALPIGGSLIILTVFDEESDQASLGFALLFSLWGLLIMAWGIYFNINNSVYFTDRGPITGTQLIFAGVLLAIVSGYSGLKKYFKK